MVFSNDVCACELPSKFAVFTSLFFLNALAERHKSNFKISTLIQDQSVAFEIVISVADDDRMPNCCITEQLCLCMSTSGWASAHVSFRTMEDLALYILKFV